MIAQGGNINTSTLCRFQHGSTFLNLYLNPINTSPSTHKFDAVDFYHVDPALGGDAALRNLVAAVHERGMRIIIDASFNHCHPCFFAFQDVIARGRSPFPTRTSSCFDSAYRSASFLLLKLLLNRFPSEPNHRTAQLNGRSLGHSLLGNAVPDLSAGIAPWYFR